MADPGDHNDALLLSYQQMLVDRVSALSLADLSSWRDLSLQLADLYVERSLAPLGSGAFSLSPSSEPGQQALPLADLVRPRGTRVLLEAEVGYGKSTCMRRLALAVAAHAIGELAQSSNMVQGWEEPPPLPLLMTGAELLPIAGEDTAAQQQDDQAAPQVWLAIEGWFEQRSFGPLVPTIRRALERGACLVMIDDVDDMLDAADPRAPLTALGEFVLRYPDNRYILTSRRLAVDPAPLLPGFARFTLAALDRPQIDAMIERWYAALADRPGVSAPPLPERIALLKGVLHGDELLQEISESPLVLALWILAHAEGQPLPAARPLILQRLCDLLLNGWGDDSLDGPDRLAQVLDLDSLATTTQRLALLEPLALALQSRQEQAADRPAALSYAEVEPLLSAALEGLGVQRDRAVELVIPRLLAWCDRRGLLAMVEPAMYAMPQRYLREYLSARALAAMPDFPAQAYQLCQEAGWRAPLVLAAYELGQGPTAQAAHEFVRLLLQSARAAGDSARREQLLGAECLLALGERSPDQTLRVEAQRSLLDQLGDRRASVAERVQAGTLLGRLGDPRFDQLLPPLAQVGAGPFILGNQGPYDDEGPAQRVHVPAFAIGVYPVTNQEYAAFLRETARPPPRYWLDARFNNPAYPVVGVTWHDAVAYCAWLSARLAQAGLLPVDTVVRLPLEAEWEKAASWDPQRQLKRRYPWGEEWDNTRANTAAGRGAWTTAPVGCYPNGVSAYGLHDCIGNVWEWTASVYASYHGAAKPFQEPGSYTLRGSSCACQPTHARCTFRSRLPANYWRYHLGFRIVIARPLSDTAS